MKRYLLASDFDQTLSFNDSGIALSEMLGLAYLLLHDPEYRRVRKEALLQVGQRIHLKRNINLLSRLLGAVDGYAFPFYLISAAPEEVIPVRDASLRITAVA